MIPDAIYLPLLAAISPAGADLTDDCQEFLIREYALFSGTDGEFLAYVRERVAEWFASASYPPVWIQNAEWQFDKGRPMLFAGQVLIPASTGMYHDDAAIFVFVNPEGVVHTVLQVA